nr:hypothetical protein [uncultured Celeribacter sp.]
MRMMSVFVFLAALAFAAGPFVVPGFGGFDPNLYPIPQNDPPVQPATYAFAIWGLIYLWLLISAGFGLIRRAEAIDWAPMRPALAVALLIGATWLPVATISPVLATVLIFAMLIAALKAMQQAPVLDPWLARAPVALFAGWLTAASFAALGLLGAGYGVIFGQVGWAYIALIGALAVALYGAHMRPDAPLYSLGVAWALIAIMLHNLDLRASSEASFGVALAAGAATLLVLANALRAWRRHELEPHHH